MVLERPYLRARAMAAIAWCGSARKRQFSALIIGLNDTELATATGGADLETRRGACLSARSSIEAGRYRLEEAQSGRQERRSRNCRVVRRRPGGPPWAGWHGEPDEGDILLLVAPVRPRLR